MAIAQGISKKVVVKAQTGLGVAAAGTGGQILRRESSTNKLTIASFENNELVSHQQSTGKTHGSRTVDVGLNGVLSPGTYSKLIASITRKAFVATTALTGLALVFGGTAGAYTITGTGLLVTSGFKVGDVVRVTAGTSLPADILNKNLLITGLTATVMSVRTINGSTITTGVTSYVACTISLNGKKTIVPITGHTKEYWTVEDWQEDIAQSEVFTDVVMGKVDIALASTGNATIGLTAVGLNRTRGTTQVLTTPTAETTALPLSSVNGILMVAGSPIANVTSVNISIDGKAASMGAVVGSVVSPDVQRGTVSVTGSFTAFYQDGSLQTAFEGNSAISLVAVVQSDDTESSAFVTFNMSYITIDSDDKDDGDKGIIRTYNFTARINPNGGPALASDNTIISIQDSAAA